MDTLLPMVGRPRRGGTETDEGVSDRQFPARAGTGALAHVLFRKLRADVRKNPSARRDGGGDRGGDGG